VLQTVLMQAAAAARRYSDPAARAGRLQQLATALRAQLPGAAAGSDRQLAFAQALAGIATSAADLELLAGLLDSSVQLDGLIVDTDLRWQLLRRLVSRGAAGAAEREAELARDATDAGARRAAACRAAIPTAAAKQAAWELITSGTLTNATFRAALGGFEDPDQPALLAPYEERYFAVLPDVWRDWSSDMARWFVSVAYPMNDSPSVIAATSDFIARADPPPGLVRLLVEGRDTVRRALRCQERDRQAGAAADGSG